MPMNTDRKFAFQSRSSISSSSPRLTLASVLNVIGKSFATCHAASLRSISVARGLLPMKLSSTKKTWVTPKETSFSSSGRFQPGLAPKNYDDVAELA